MFLAGIFFYFFMQESMLEKINTTWKWSFDECYLALTFNLSEGCKLTKREIRYKQKTEHKQWKEELIKISWK